MRTQHLGPEELLVGAKVSFRDGLAVARAGRRGQPGRGRRARRRARGAGHVHRARRAAHGPGGPHERGPTPAGRRQLEALGELIRKQRQQAELTLRELAERTNVSNPYLSQIERGLHEPSVRVLKAIAAALNLSAESLLVQAGVLDGHDEPRPSRVTVEEAVDGRPPAHRRPAGRPDERLPELRRGRSEAAAQASLSAQERRSGGRGAARSHRVPRGTGGWPEGQGSGGLGGLDDLLGLGEADDRRHGLEDGGDDGGVGVDQLLGEGDLRLDDLDGGREGRSG